MSKNVHTPHFISCSEYNASKWPVTSTEVAVIPFERLKNHNAVEQCGAVTNWFDHVG